MLMSGKKALLIGYGDVGKGSAMSLRQEGMIVKITEVDPICAFQACMDGFEVVSPYIDGINTGSIDCINKELLSTTDLIVTTTGNTNVCDSAMLRSLKAGSVVCNIGHFDNEIDTFQFRKELYNQREVQKMDIAMKIKGWAKGLADVGVSVNLGNATGHPSRIMDGSFANQVLAQIELYKRKFAAQDESTQAKMLQVEVLPKHLDEEVARYMVAGFGGVLTKLTQEQADYIGVKQEGPYKPEYYRY